MYENTDKRQLYWLIDQYLSNKMNTLDFCDKYHDCYDMELDLDCLSKKEYRLFSNLSLLASRFSPFKEDHAIQPFFFLTDEKLREKVIEVKELLKDS